MCIMMQSVKFNVLHTLSLLIALCQDKGITRCFTKRINKIDNKTEMDTCLRMQKTVLTEKTQKI